MNDSLAMFWINVFSYLNVLLPLSTFHALSSPSWVHPSGPFLFSRLFDFLLAFSPFLSWLPWDKKWGYRWLLLHLINKNKNKNMNIILFHLNALNPTSREWITRGISSVRTIAQVYRIVFFCCLMAPTQYVLRQHKNHCLSQRQSRVYLLGTSISICHPHPISCPQFFSKFNSHCVHLHTCLG